MSSNKHKESSACESPMRVAIIGGGVSGLGTAYYLNQSEVEVTLYESVHHVGGNCRTVDLSVGKAIQNPGESAEGINTTMPLKRWVDIGVNDFNKNSYVNIVKMLDKLNVPYAPLEDTISFSGAGNCSSIPGSGYTMDTTWGNNIPETIENGSIQFAAYVSDNIDKFLCSSGKFYNATIGDFLNDPEVSSKYSELKMNSDFVNYNLFPHINAMYFASGIAPSDMPARMVIHYFHLQEGYGTGQGADRMYWVNGSQDWIQHLKAYLTARGVQININTTAQFKYYETGVSVTVDEGKSWENYDAVVLGVQAKQLESTFAEPSAIPAYIYQIAGAITYSNDEVVVHSCSAELPSNVSAWRTYNVNMYDTPNKGQDYRMTYVINRHQNDVKNPDHNFATDPQYFCSLNPKNSIPKESYLLGPNTVPQECTMFNFYHTILPLKAQECQDTLIPDIQGKNNIWLVGGYTCGTGLQEECWEAARNIAAKMLDPSHEFDHIYNKNKSGRDGIPLHIRMRLIVDVKI